MARPIADLEQPLAADAQAQAPDDYERLVSVPGIGPRTALALLLVGPGLRAFAGARQAVAYAGLCPRPYESGARVRDRARLSKLRYVAAWSASRHKPACAAHYQRLLAAGKAKKQALCAVAARLFRQAWGVLHHKQLFSPDYHWQVG